MIALVLVPAALQALVMLVDEGWYHRRRGLGRWERLGHPLDTFSVALAYAWLATHPQASRGALVGYVALAVLSSLLVTKDEPVHARECSAGEHRFLELTSIEDVLGFAHRFEVRLPKKTVGELTPLKPHPAGSSDER